MTFAVKVALNPNATNQFFFFIFPGCTGVNISSKQQHTSDSGCTDSSCSHWHATSPLSKPLPAYSGLATSVYDTSTCCWHGNTFLSCCPCLTVPVVFCQEFFWPFIYRQNFRLVQIESINFADNKINMTQKWKLCFRKVENIVGKWKMLIISIFSLSHDIFKSRLLQDCWMLGLCDKNLLMC